jgi:outer membrane lipoprotein-sorting protein
MKRYFFVGLLPALLSILAGCGTTAVRPPYRDISPEMVYRSVHEQQAQIRLLHGEGQMTVESPEFAQSASFTLFIKKPDSLLVKINGPFGVEVGAALVTRNEFTFYNTLQNQVITGSTNASNLGRALRMRLTFDEMMDLFTGGSFFVEDRGAAAVVEREGEQIVLTYAHEMGSRRYVIDPVSLLIRRILHLDSRGEVEAEQRFSNFKTVGGASVPHSVRLIQQKERRALSIAYVRVRVNQNEPAPTLDVPASAERIQWR